MPSAVQRLLRNADDFECPLWPSLFGLVVLFSAVDTEIDWGRIEAKGFDSEASLATPVSLCSAFPVREFAGPRHSQNDVVSANRPCGSRS
jgi:hypothetical protein